MSSVLEMVTELVVAQLKNNPMTKEELLKTIRETHATMVALEKGDDQDIEVEFFDAPEEVKPLMSAKKSIGKNTITCLICGESMKTLSRHLKSKHDMMANVYRKQFGIPRTQALAAKAYSESRKQMAIDSGLGEKLIAARAANAAKRAAAPKAKKDAVKGKKTPSPKAGKET